MDNYLIRVDTDPGSKIIYVVSNKNIFIIKRFPWAKRSLYDNYF